MYVDPVLKENGMVVTYVSGVRNLEELEEKMRKENEEKARASEGSGVILTDSSSKNEEKEVEVRELSSFLSTLDEKGEGNFISNSSLTQETQNEREKLLSLSSKEGEGGKRLFSLTISNEKEMRFGKNLGSASSNGGGERIFDNFFYVKGGVREHENIEKERKKKENKNEEEREKENDGRREEELDPTKP